MQKAGWRFCRWCVVPLLLAGGCRPQTATHSVEEPAVAIDSAEGKRAIAITGLTPGEHDAVANMLPEALGKILTVRVAGAGEDVPDVAGSVVYDDATLHFEPRYPLQPGVRYRAVFYRSRIPGGDAAAEDVVDEFEIAKAEPGPATTVTRVYPTSDRLPENLLKFYVHFSAPMSRGEAYRRVHLLDAEGNEVDAPFLELGEELWDPGMTRFTLLLDPGRIKRGLKPREDVGPVLEAGRRYTFVVDRDWHDAKGQLLAGELRKSFVVLPPDEEPIDIDGWRIESPEAGATDPLVVRFGEPLDHALLERMVRAADSDGEPVAGSIEITDDETCWRFTPSVAWAAGDYQLVADTTLEDLAGNSIGRAFDVDVFEPVQKRITSETVAIPFSVPHD